MSCSIIGDKIKVSVKEPKGQSRQAVDKMHGSALQNPDMSRVQLASLLRRQKSGVSDRSHRTFWDAFLAQQREAHANMNDYEA